MHLNKLKHTTKGKNMSLVRSLCSFIVLLSSLIAVYGQGTRIGFYSTTCPNAEAIVRTTVTSHFGSDPKIAPGLLRMHFHDCYGSVLISGPNTERTAGANFNLRGFEVIEDAKRRLEAACPGVVSCADILTLAARDSVALTKGPRWQVPTGRRDGRVSLAANVNNLPSPSDSVAIQQRKFAAFRLNTRDLVALVGGHTIGTAACGFFTNRIFNSTGNTADPTMDQTFVPQLQRLCPQNGDGSNRVDLDAGSGNTFDTSFFNNLSRGRGILQSDHVLWTNPTTRRIVQEFMASRGNFSAQFASSMIKMSNIGVKTGANGEIRRVCTAVN